MECKSHESLETFPELNLSAVRHRKSGKNGNFLLESWAMAGNIYISTGSGYGLQRNEEVNSVMTVSLCAKL